MCATFLKRVSIDGGMAELLHFIQTTGLAD